VRILLDECIPKRLARELTDHQVRTVQQCGWSALKNGRLMELAQREFEAFVTVDQNLQYQQKVSGFEIAVVVLVAKSNDIDDLRPLMPQVRSILTDLRVGAVVRIEISGDS
jgi:predicted nuclease of predicted toxin-antitoxin system